MDVFDAGDGGIEIHCKCPVPEGVDEFFGIMAPTNAEDLSDDSREGPLDLDITEAFPELAQAIDRARELNEAGGNVAVLGVKMSRRLEKLTWYAQPGFSPKVLATGHDR